MNRFELLRATNASLTTISVLEGISVGASKQPTLNKKPATLTSTYWPVSICNLAEMVLDFDGSL